MNDTLSWRELLVVKKSVWGYTNKEIAAWLRISVKTVESHKNNAMRKLRLNTRSELVKYAVGMGWFASGEPQLEAPGTSSGDLATPAVQHDPSGVRPVVLEPPTE